MTRAPREQGAVLSDAAKVLAGLSVLMLVLTFFLPGDLSGWLNQVTVLLFVGLPFASATCLICSWLRKDGML